MTVDINARLARLKVRRNGTDRLSILNKSEQASVVSKALIQEAWQKRSTNKLYTQYALGAMQEVDPDYTRVSIETAIRVGNQLDTNLTTRGFVVGFRLQGSVPLNVHIRGISDVDLLLLDESFFTYERGGLSDSLGLYRSPTPKTSITELLNLRSAAEDILSSKFPAANVDKSGGKAIAISGGSLARPVDVVPSHWHDSMEYQRNRNEDYRAVRILNKKVPETIVNLPFVHIALVNQADVMAQGGIKKAIRLCKNIKNDACEEGRNIFLPSFDITALMYHANHESLRNNTFYELSVLAETQRWLDELYHNKDKACSLVVPDGTRKIIDTEEKYRGLRALSCEIDNLAKEVAKEQNALLLLQEQLSFSDVRLALGKAHIAG